MDDHCRKSRTKSTRLKKIASLLVSCLFLCGLYHFRAIVLLELVLSLGTEQHKKSAINWIAIDEPLVCERLLDLTVQQSATKNLVRDKINYGHVESVSLGSLFDFNTDADNRGLTVEQFLTFMRNTEYPFRTRLTRVTPLMLTWSRPHKSSPQMSLSVREERLSQLLKTWFGLLLENLQEINSTTAMPKVTSAKYAEDYDNFWLIKQLTMALCRLEQKGLSDSEYETVIEALQSPTITQENAKLLSAFYTGLIQSRMPDLVDILSSPFDTKLEIQAQPAPDSLESLIFSVRGSPSKVVNVKFRSTKKTNLFDELLATDPEVYAIEARVFFAYASLDSVIRHYSMMAGSPGRNNTASQFYRPTWLTNAIVADLGLDKIQQSDLVSSKAKAQFRRLEVLCKPIQKEN